MERILKLALPMVLVATAASAADVLPSPEQVQDAIGHTTKAVTEGKLAWESWAAILGAVYPVVVHSVAILGGLQNIPILGPILNAIAGIYGAAKNEG